MEPADQNEHEEPSVDVFVCNHCLVPLLKVRFKCILCVDVDLCEQVIIRYVGNFVYYYSNELV